MIKVEKDFNKIPPILQNKKREEAFLKNVKVEKFEFGTKLYKTKKVQERLKDIYHLKCAYCEKKLLDAPKHIEHYRPKDTYYWLAYSWDNLLLSCGECNSFKGVHFKTDKTKSLYNNETFDTIHSLGMQYDESEKPYIVNPEKEDILELIKYRVDGTVYSEDERVNYTIEIACRLNRAELVEKRVMIINDFNNKIKSHYKIFTEHGDITRFEPEINDLLLKTTKKHEFYALRHYLVNHIEVFFEDENIQKIVKSLIERVKNERN